MATEEIKTLLYNIFCINFDLDNTHNVYYANFNTPKYIVIIYNNYYLKITVTNQNCNNIIKCLNKNFELGYVESSYQTNDNILCKNYYNQYSIFNLCCIKFVLYNKLKNVYI